MGRQRSQPKPSPQPPVDSSPFESEEEEESVGGGIPDDDGWIHLKGKEPADGETPKRKPGRRSD